MIDLDSENNQILCTWNDQVNCIECSINEKLFCKYNRKKWLSFVWVLTLLLVTEILGVITIGLQLNIWWPLITYEVVTITFFILGIKTFILCRHCPFYAEESKVLHCLANTGVPKIWKYKSSPMNLFEKILLLIFFFFIFMWGIGWEIYSIYYFFSNYTSLKLISGILIIILLISNFTFVILFIIKLQKQYCPFCPNFSCPMNKVSKEIIDEYLEKNPVIKEAWLKKGYKSRK